MHMLDAVLLRHRLWSSMKRTLAFVKILPVNMLCFKSISIYCWLAFLMPECINHAVARGSIQNLHSYRGHFHA